MSSIDRRAVRRFRIRRIVWLLVAHASIGCGVSNYYSRSAGNVGVMTTRRVEWNVAHTDVGAVNAVADLGDDVVVFSNSGATILASGAITAIDRTNQNWIGAGTLPAADGIGSWIVGIGGDGKLRRLRGGSSLEIVSDRYGLGRDRVRAMAAFGNGFVGFALDGTLAISDGTSVERFDYGSFSTLVGGGGFAAGIVDAESPSIRLLDPKHRSAAAFPVKGVRLVTLDDQGRLYAATSHAIYAHNDGGQLTLRYFTEQSEITGLVSSRTRIWFADGDELGAIENGVIESTQGAKLPLGTRLFPSSSGDVWAIANGSLARFARANEQSAPAQRWATVIQPIFARACAVCHLPNGPAGVDLSTHLAWQRARDDVYNRVVIKRSMPPSGHTISESDRETIGAWLKPTATQ